MGTDWAQVVREHGPAVWLTARRLLGHEADAADCFQETFVAAVKLSRRQAVRNWPALLRRLTTTKALDRLRQRRSESVRVGFTDALNVPGREPAPAAVAEAAELAERLRLALAELPSQQAEAFCLHCLEGQTYEQIAEQLSVSVSHVGVLIHRARAKLRESMGFAVPNDETKGSVLDARSPA